MNKEQILKELKALDIKVTARYFKPSDTEIKVISALIEKAKNAAMTDVPLRSIGARNDTV